jgi:hypothetical protein
MVSTAQEVQLRWTGTVREQAVENGCEQGDWCAEDTAEQILGSAGDWCSEDTAEPLLDPPDDGCPTDTYRRRHRPLGVESIPDPEDELFVLGERCASAYLQADALHYEAMRLLAEFHHREGWQDTGFGSTAEWLAWRIGILPGAARERVRTALALQQLPRTSEAMKNGELSFTKVRALTRVATPDTEEALLDFARAGSAANLERVVRGWKTLDRKSEVTAEQIRYRSRRFSTWVDDDGMVVVRGRLDPEAGAVFMRAVEAASDALYRQEDPRAGGGQSRELSGCGGSDDAGPDDETRPEQRRADAVGLLAERALAKGFGDEGVSGSRAQRYQVMLHVDAGTLEEDGDVGQSELEDGTRVSAETSRRVACDASVVTITHAPDGGTLGAGRRTRTVPPSVRRALEARDRGCRFPGCGLRFTDAHHVKHWADGGETSLRNLVLLCRRHHRVVHEGGVRVCVDRTGQVVFFTPGGKALFEVPERAGVGTMVEGRAREWAVGTGGVAVTGNGGPVPGQPLGAALCKRDSDIPWTIEARAWEALDPG